MATHSNILAWRIPWAEEPGGLYSPWGCKESDMTEATKNACTHNTICLHPVPQCQLYRACNSKIRLTKPDTFGNILLQLRQKHTFPVYGL